MFQVSIRHGKKLYIDELESIVNLKLVDASSLKLTKHNGRLRGCKECTTKMDKFEEECAKRVYVDVVVLNLQEVDGVVVDSGLVDVVINKKRGVDVAARGFGSVDVRLLLWAVWT
ncbi:hypothetical protein Bca4012_082442 [Brassica carinata]|uniref:Uncharacterized protein n=1 Tax=Brassica carinata TaxID=52824 RepID=A0A8X8AMK7_BRACI|nr:hypothetical protein Bca52824_028218 [Brassica carinata]